MSAQPVEPVPTPDRVVLPRETKAIRAALTPEEREQFAAALDDADTGGVVQVIEYWWMRGALNLSGTWETIRRFRAGELRTIPIEDVLPELRAAR